MRMTVDAPRRVVAYMYTIQPYLDALMDMVYTHVSSSPQLRAAKRSREHGRLQSTSTVYGMQVRYTVARLEACTLTCKTCVPVPEPERASDIYSFVSSLALMAIPAAPIASSGAHPGVRAKPTTGGNSFLSHRRTRWWSILYWWKQLICQPVSVPERLRG